MSASNMLTPMLRVVVDCCAFSVCVYTWLGVCHEAAVYLSQTFCHGLFFVAFSIPRQEHPVFLGIFARIDMETVMSRKFLVRCGKICALVRTTYSLPTVFWSCN